MEDALNHLNPQNILQRGYSITTMNGKILKSVRPVSPNAIIETHVADGYLKSKVVEKKAENQNESLNF